MRLDGVWIVRLRVAIGLAAIVGGFWLTIAFIGTALSEPSAVSSQRVATELGDPALAPTIQRVTTSDLRREGTQEAALSMLAVAGGVALVRPPLKRDRQLVRGSTAMFGVIALLPVTVCIWFIAVAVTSATRSLVG